MFFNWYKERYNIKVKKLKGSYKEDLVKRIPVNNNNIDNYLQIDFFLAFLDSRFNDESIYQLFDNNINPSPNVFEYSEYPFNYREDKIEYILSKVETKLRERDTLWIKYYLEEEGLNNMLLFYDQNKRLKISYYDKLINTIEDSSLKLNFENTKKLINNIKKENNSLKQWQGRYSFKYGRTHMEQVTKGEVRFEITEGSQKVFFDEQEKPLTVRASYKDSIILTGKDEKDYIIYRMSPNEYAVKGHHIYMLSPPNDNYPLTKKE